MKILVTYQSKTGFTKKYAEWICSELKGELQDIKNLNNINIQDYDLIIYGGWIMGGMIMGLGKIRNLNPKKLIVFGVGYTSKKDVNIEKMAEVNQLSDTPLFYYQGGMDPKKMGFINKMIVKMVTKEKIVYKDNTNKEDIESLIKMVKDYNKK